MAQTEVRDGGTIKLRGQVQIISAGVAVFADEADYDMLSGDLQARGHVHVVFQKSMPAAKIQDSNPEDTPVR
jgi:lipopolysaccharide assembly outer membrane protein LptD (OstA)